MIRSFRHKGIETFFLTGKMTGVQAKHAKRLRLQFAALDKAKAPGDMNAPNWRLHPLEGEAAGRWSIWVDENWRLTFAFKDGDAELVDYQDYH